MTEVEEDYTMSNTLNDKDSSDLIDSFDSILCEIINDNFDFIQMHNYDFDNHLQDCILKNFNHLHIIRSSLIT